MDLLTMGTDLLAIGIDLPKIGKNFLTMGLNLPAIKRNLQAMRTDLQTIGENLLTIGTDLQSYINSVLKHYQSFSICMLIDLTICYQKLHESKVKLYN
jgi:hypothetical protein